MNVFDILGPVMIGPSSSHTAGAARIGQVALALLGERCVKADILLHGSFAKTYKGHGTDRALIAGIMGLSAEDSRLRSAVELAKEAGLEVQISTGEIEDAHPNTALLHLTSVSGKELSVLGSSVGGGNIQITKVNGMQVLITGQKPTLLVLHRDTPGIIATVTEVLSDAGVNICSFSLSREKKGGQAVMTIELEGRFDAALNDRISALPQVFGSTMLLPV